MSVYIKGMEMPTSCYKCPVNKDDGFGYFTCGVTHSECDFMDLPADCPLVPVPEHGRLIDADAMLNKYYNGSMDGKHINYAGVITPVTVASMPTIIPADKEGEG